MTNGTLAIWTVYKHPKDYPNDYVARKHTIGAFGSHPSVEMFAADTLEEIRALIPLGLVCLGRAPDDEAQIVETWL